MRQTMTESQLTNLVEQCTREALNEAGWFMQSRRRRVEASCRKAMRLADKGDIEGATRELEIAQKFAGKTNDRNSAYAQQLLQNTLTYVEEISGVTNGEETGDTQTQIDDIAQKANQYQIGQPAPWSNNPGYVRAWEKVCGLRMDRGTWGSECQKAWDDFLREYQTPQGEGQTQATQTTQRPQNGQPQITGGPTAIRENKKNRKRA